MVVAVVEEEVEGVVVCLCSTIGLVPAWTWAEEEVSKYRRR